MKNHLFDKIKSYCKQLETGFDQIPATRKVSLERLGNYIISCYKIGEKPKLIVVCTHNSRRSHIGQIFLALAADFYQLPEMATFSGGTEATAFNPRAVAAVWRIGLEIDVVDEKMNNPEYLLKWQPDMVPYKAFSKKYSHGANPSKDFAAIMVCTEADEGCPLILGCDFRLSLPFQDPKAYDDTPEEEAQYDLACRLIGREMLYVAGFIKESLAA